MAIRSTGPLSTACVACVINRRTFIIIHSHSGGAWPPLVGLPRNVVIPSTQVPVFQWDSVTVPLLCPQQSWTARPLVLRPVNSPLSHQEQGVEHDRLSE